MKKDEYLNKLSQGLKQYDQAYIQEILDDYEEHFQDALAQGQSEEDICRELGDPQESDPGNPGNDGCSFRDS